MTKCNETTTVKHPLVQRISLYPLFTVDSVLQKVHQAQELGGWE